jgi:flagellar protein FliS
MSPSSSAAAAYRASQFENAPPLAIVRMLYEGALRFLDQAEAALASGDAVRFQERCLRIAGIVAELRLALDPSQAPALAKDLEALYHFVEAELRAALSEDSAARLAPVKDVLTKLLAGWRTLEVRP